MAKSKKTKQPVNLDETVVEETSGEPVTVEPKLIDGDKNTLEVLEDQDKVMLLIEKRRGEYPEMDFTVNGVRYTVKRGVPSLVPKQIAQMWFERQQSEGRLTDTSKAMMENLKKM